jgi:hypothetical protein
MSVEQKPLLNHWGALAILALAAAIPAAFAVSAFSGGNTPVSDVTGLMFLLSAI